MKPSKNFYQWDINQKFTECDGRFVDFIINEKVVYRVDIVNGECIIPDEFLQTSGYHMVYECMSDYTVQNHMFPVHPREKPPTYVYTPTEKLTFEGLVQKVDDTVADIIHRADSGEFDGYTPVKGKDYFTESEKSEMIQDVSSGAVGEFREVVDSATADFNKNSSVKINDYNTNAEKKVDVYDSNAAEKLKAYNDNHTEKMMTYDTNATDKLSTYNQNHTAKVAEYNQNAAALQTEVDRLRGECDTLAAENRKQENKISALIKLNKGQTYDILPEDGETASRTAPSGAKYVSVDKVGGRSVVWNQLNNPADNINVQKGAIKLNDDGSITISGTVQDAGKYNELQISQSIVFAGNQKYLVITNKILSICVNGHDKSTTDALLYASASDWTGYVALGVANGDDVNIEELAVQVYNLTQMFGAGNEPTIEQFKKMFAQKIYPHNAGEIISGTTANVELEGKNLWDDTDPAFTQSLLNAGFEYNSGIWNCNNIVYSSVDINVIPPLSVLAYDILASKNLNARIELFAGETRLLAHDLASTGEWKHHSINIPSEMVIDRIVVDYASRGACKIKNIQLERGTSETAYSPHTKQSITTGFPELHSAGTAHDEIDMDGGQVIRNVYTVKIETLPWQKNADNRFVANLPVKAKANGTLNNKNNELCNTYESKTMNELFAGEKGIATHSTTGEKVWIYDNAYETPEQLVASLSGAVLQYELETPTTEPVTIPEALQEWLPVEPGGTVTFRNADDSKQLAIPNEVSWVRKLDEVN